MRTDIVRKFTLILLLALVTASGITALAEANIVPVSHLLDQSSGITLAELAPPECDSIQYSLESIVDCSTQVGACSGFGNSNELILGTSGHNMIDGNNGDDCIVGGDGNDNLYGGNGNDVLVGGPGSDSLYGDGRNKDTDICIDDPATSYLDATCEGIP